MFILPPNPAGNDLSVIKFESFWPSSRNVYLVERSKVGSTVAFWGNLAKERRQSLMNIVYISVCCFTKVFRR